MIVRSALPVPVPIPVVATGGSTFDFLLRDVRHKAVPGRIVSEFSPRDRMMVFAQPQKATKAHYRVGDPAGLLVDHEVVDCADVGTIITIDVSSVHIVR